MKGKHSMSITAIDVHNPCRGKFRELDVIALIKSADVPIATR